MKEYKKLFFIVGVIFFFLSAYFFDVGGKTIISKILYAIGAMFVFTFMTFWQKKETFYPSPCGARCVEYPSYPSSRFMKDPFISDEENEANLKKMMANLASYKKSMDNDK